MSNNRIIPYGYTVRNGKLIIEPTEASNIRKIFDDYIAGASLKEIADELTNKKIPFTIKSCEWSKARIARILDNAKYTGDNEYDPIIDDAVYELAAECKKTRLTNSEAACSKEITVIRERLKCEKCGHPMVRRIINNSTQRISWVCQNGDCGVSIRISDSALIEKVRLLMNRVIKNSNLMIPVERPPKKISPEVAKIRESIDLEAHTETPSQMLVVDLINKIAAEHYKESCSKEAITARIAKQRVDLMEPQSTFNETYFNDIVKTVLIGENETVRIITKTEARIE